MNLLEWAYETFLQNSKVINSNKLQDQKYNLFNLDFSFSEDICWKIMVSPMRSAIQITHFSSTTFCYKSHAYYLLYVTMSFCSDPRIDSSNFFGVLVNKFILRLSNIWHREYNQYYNNLIWMHGNYIYHGDHFIMYKSIKSLWHTPETNRILYIN